MSDKRYPTRMHEVLGVEPGERFKIIGSQCIDDFCISIEGRLQHADNPGLACCRSDLEYAINNGIVRHTRLTEEQVRHLKGLYLLGFRWIERDEHDALVAWENYDDKADVFQNDFLPLSYRSYQVLTVVPTRNAPLNIVQTLRDAGVEVEG